MRLRHDALGRAVLDVLLHVHRDGLVQQKVQETFLAEAVAAGQRARTYVGIEAQGTEVSLAFLWICEKRHRLKRDQGHTCQ